MRRTTALLLVAWWISAASVHGAPIRTAKVRPTAAAASSSSQAKKKAKATVTKTKKKKKPAKRIATKAKAIVRGKARANKRGQGQSFVPAVRAELVEAALMVSPPEMVPPIPDLAPRDLYDSFAAPRGRGRAHRAIDIMRPEGTPLVACVDGVIEKLHTSAAGGMAIYLLDEAKRYRFYYAHLSAYAEGLSEGMAVARGTVIGYVGSTGNASASAPHLHFQVMLAPQSGGNWGSDAGVVNPHPLLVELVNAGVQAEPLPLVPALPATFAAPAAAMLLVSVPEPERPQK